jgi:hypothetical protein
MRVEIRQVHASDPLVDSLLVDPTLRGSEEIWAGLADGELVIIWGLIPASLLSDRACLWSHTTEAVGKCRKTFIKLSRLAVRQALASYPVLFGICDGSTSWLRYLGAEIDGNYFIIKA